MNKMLAAIVFFTRIPLWRLKEIPGEEFKHIVSRWSICGWITGGVMALTFLILYPLTTLEIAVVGAMISRILLTGALHEDGMADFFDGFGGGRDREGILRIMKDSHIGSYGVLGLVLYYLLSYTLLTALPPAHIPVLLLCTDAFCKFVSSFLTVTLPYARKEEDSKAKVIYEKFNTGDIVLTTLGGLLPLAMLFVLPLGYCYLPALIVPPVVFLTLRAMMKRGIHGYTGDCCGAMFLLTELSMRLALVVSMKVCLQLAV